jgi:hypothetical protein
MYLLRVVRYRAMYEVLDDGVHAEVLDFPGVILCGKKNQRTYNAALATGAIIG